MFSIIIAILLVLNENYLARAEAENNAEKISELLSDVENRQRDIKDLLDESQNIRSTLPKWREDIAAALTKNSLLIEGKDALEEGKAKGDNVNKCQALLDLKMEWLIHKIHHYLTNTINHDLDYVEESLQSTGQKLDKLQNDLDSCNDKNSSCEDLDKLTDDLNECSETITRFKTLIPHLIENFLHDLEKVEAPTLIRDNILLPVIECL